MDANPYRPPATPQADPPDTSNARPIAAWLLIAAIAAFSVLLAVAVIRIMIAGAPGDGIAVAIGWRIALLVALIATAFAVFRRRSWGRWMGVIALVGLAIAMVLVPDTARYANASERAGGLIGRAFLVLVTLWWVYAFGFSAKAKRYFTSAATATPSGTLPRES